MAEPLLHAGEQRLVLARLDEDHPAGRKSGLGERRREQVLSGDAPQHLSGEARGNPRGEQRRGRAIDCSVGAARHLMQAPQRQPTSRKPPVDVRHAERQDPPRAAPGAFETLDALPQLGDDGTDDTIRHGVCDTFPGLGNGLLRCYVLFLFLTASRVNRTPVEPSDGGSIARTGGFDARW